MSMPQHHNPENLDRIASAPYNFVPLPEKVVLAVKSVDDLPNHNQYYPDRLTGYLDVTLTTRSPLYIRGPIPQADYGRDEDENAKTPFRDRLKNHPDFFYVDPATKKPVIPGSSLRGMLRQMVEVVGYGKVTRVTDKKLFFRINRERIQFKNSPLDLIPDDLRRPEDIDYADAMFGYVRTPSEIDDMVKRGVFETHPGSGSRPAQGNKHSAYAGRISVTNATTTSSDLFSDGVTVPRILASPKPAAIQHYLTQDREDKRDLNLYDGDPERPSRQPSVLRGHKYYWHQGANPRYSVLDNSEPVETTSTQHTTIRPVRVGAVFKFRVYFENLSAEELGVLVWAIRPFDHRETIGGSLNTQEYCHSLGMGKPLGLGAVRLAAVLKLEKRCGGMPENPDRYSGLFNDNGTSWREGDNGETLVDLADRNTLKDFTARFESSVLDTLGANRGGAGVHHLSELARIAVLLKMMEWPGQIPDNRTESKNVIMRPVTRPNTRYMSLDEHNLRPILPSPFDPRQEAARPDIARRPFGSLSGYRVPESQVPAQVENRSVEDRTLTGEEARILRDFIGMERAPTSLTQGDELAAQITNIRGDGYDCVLEAPGTLVGDLRYGEAIPNRPRALPVGTRILVRIRRVISPKKYFVTMKGVRQEAITNQ